MLKKLSCRNCAGRLDVRLRRLPRAPQISDDVVKIGVLNDQSGLYADVGGRRLGRRRPDGGGGVRRQGSTASRSRSSPPTTRTRPISPPTSRASGSIPEGVDAIADLCHLLRGAGGAGSRARQEPQGDLISGRGHLAPDGRRLLADRLPLGLRHLCAGGRHRPRRGRARAARSWFFITADYAFGHSLEEDVTESREGAGR